MQSDEQTHEALVSWLQPDETAADLLARTVTEAIASGVPAIDMHTQLRPGQVLEIVGPTGSGKSEILLQVKRQRRVDIWAC
jgi:ABC-type phosphonate transport system ATPase subunit